MNDQKWLLKWLKIRKELYRQLEAEVRHRLGREEPGLVSYRQEYNQEFRKKWQTVPKEDLLSAFKNSRLILMGDFHALQQSQKAHLRIFKSLPKKSKIVLGLECFDAEDQVHIDRFMQGKSSEHDFLKDIDWQNKWGFPWEYYKPLIRWAQKNKIKVYGLNKTVRKYSAAGLRTRDQFAAKKIAEIIGMYPDSSCVVIYGDLHIAEKHLPAEIYKILGEKFRKQTLRIFQNAEEIYFQLLARELESSVDVVRLSRRDYCLMSVPPWVKWQNYLMYLEQAYDLELGDEEDALDYTDHVGRYVHLIAEELGFKVSLANLSVATARDSFLWQNLEEKFSSKELKWIEKMIEEGNSFYLPEVGTAYLARPSVNHAASLAMQFLHAQACQRKALAMHMPKDFMRQIWVEGMAYFGSKIVNHKRKTDTIADIKASLASRNSPELGKEVLMLALTQKMQEVMAVSGRTLSRGQFVPKNKWSYVQASALLGGIMGERLYTGYRKKMISPATLQNFLHKDTESDSFRNIYYEMLETIEALPVSFKSKKEKL